jgi:hypothetical protein
MNLKMATEETRIGHFIGMPSALTHVPLKPDHFLLLLGPGRTAKLKITIIRGVDTTIEITFEIISYMKGNLESRNQHDRTIKYVTNTLFFNNRSRVSHFMMSTVGKLTSTHYVIYWYYGPHLK